MGHLLKRFGLTNDAYLKTSDRLIYFIFFPVLLFWKIGGADTSSGISWNLCIVGGIAITLIYLVSAAALKMFRVSAFKAGTFSQSCYRFNTYIGMAVVMNALGEEGVRYFGILIGFLIPAINVMAVSVLIWYSDLALPLALKIRCFIKALVSNPLILGCAGGILVSISGVSFPAFLNNTFALVSSVTLPLALISIGGTLSFQGISRYGRQALAACLFKLVLLPAAGFILLKIFGVTGIAFRTGMIFFCLPTSTALYVLSAQLNSDLELASAAIMLSTLLSFASLSVALVL